MKKLALPGVVATALTLLVSPAFASGWIVVDPIGPGVRPVTMPFMPRPVHPRPGILFPSPHPTPTPSPIPGPILKGGVSFGLHLQSEDVKVDVNGPVSRTYITQVFSNDTDQNLAGTYLFPLPDDTTFSSFTLEIDGKPVEGKILEAQAAREQYEQIVRQLVDPGLLEYADYKTVRARVFPIPAHGTKKIQLEYTQTLKADAGLFKYRFPLRAEENATPAEAININVKLSSPHGLKTIWSPSHTIVANREGDHKAAIKYEGKNVLPDKDFCLYYSVSDKELAADLLAQKAADQDGYFLLSVAPPVAATSVQKKDIVLVADTSGSMLDGNKLEDCKKSLKYMINSLNPGDRFGLVQFNTDAEAFRSDLLEVNAENKKAAMSFIDDLEARGGTNIGEALSLGTSILNKGDAARPAFIVMMTDGEPTVGQTSVDQLIKLPGTKRDIRLFDFGVGYDVNTRLLNKLAEGHHGTAQYVEPSENLETVLGSFSNKIKSPVLSDVKISYEGVEVKDVYPREVKDIYAGSQVLLIGKYKTSGNAKVKITGKLAGTNREFTFPVTFPKEESGHSYLNRLWAMRRIGYLTDVAQANGNAREIVDEIVALSKKYGIITQYTSFLATDPNEVNAHGMPIRRMGGGGPAAAPMPAGAWAVRGGSGGVAGGAVDGFAAQAASPSSHSVHGSLHHVATRSLEKATAFNAPREMQLMEDDRAIVRDLRASDSAASGMKDLRGDLKYAPGKTAFGLAMPSSPTMSESGQDAVLRAKKASNLRNTIAVDKEESAGRVKSVEDKTFYLVRGYWTDSEFDSKQKPEEIEFASSRYFDLVSKNPELRKYLSVATNVVVVFNGHCYKIVPAKTA